MCSVYVTFKDNLVSVLHGYTNCLGFDLGVWLQCIHSNTQLLLVTRCHSEGIGTWSN